MSNPETLLVLLDEIRHYYGNNRGIGHTQAALTGLSQSPKALFVVGERNPYFTLMARRERLEIIPLTEVSQRTLSGLHRPLVWDNSAIIAMLEMFLEVIEARDKEIQRYIRALACERASGNAALRRERAIFSSRLDAKDAEIAQILATFPTLEETEKYSGTKKVHLHCVSKRTGQRTHNRKKGGVGKKVCKK